MISTPLPDLSDLLFPQTPTHRDIQKLFQKAKDSPLLPQLSVSFIRSMSLACYSSRKHRPLWPSSRALLPFHQPDPPLYRSHHPAASLRRTARRHQISIAIATRLLEKERISFRAESSVKSSKNSASPAPISHEDPTESIRRSSPASNPLPSFSKCPNSISKGRFMSLKSATTISNSIPAG